jgi:hypothetical protein
MKEAAKDHSETAPHSHADRCDWCMMTLLGVLITFSLGNLAIVLMLLK